MPHPPLARAALAAVLLLPPEPRPPCATARCTCATDDVPHLPPGAFVPRQLDEATAVVLARVERVDTLAQDATARAPTGRAVVARLRVERRWKGPAGARLTVAFGWVPDAMPCETVLAPGGRYVVFALPPAAGGPPWTARCTGTRPAADAAAVIAALDSLASTR